VPTLLHSPVPSPLPSPLPSRRPGRRTAALAAAGTLAAATALSAFTAAPAGAVNDAQRASARRAADYVVGQVGPDGAVVSGYDGAPSIGLSYRAALALAEAGHGYGAFQRALGLAATKVDAYTLTSSGGVRAGAAGLAAVVAVAAGASPTSFGGRDLVARVLSTQAASGELVDAGYAGSLNHSIALFGLAAAGLTSADSRVAAAASWLAGQQCADGGWQNGERTRTGATTAPCVAADEDVQTSGYAVQALLAVGATPSGDAFAYFRAAQNPQGGWGYSAGDESSGDGTGIVASALAALGVDAEGTAAARGGHTPAAVLRALQKPAGSSNAGAYPYQAGADGDAVYSTSDGVAGELGQTLPRATVTFDDAPAPPQPAPVLPPAGPPAAGPPTAQAPGPFCAVVFNPRGRKTAVPDRCVPGTPHQTPCTVFLNARGAKHVGPAGCLPLPVRQTPCSVVRDRAGHRFVLPKSCLPLFSTGARR